ncbi:DEHA2B14014p [Debaryomyces hansenii CBS767]|uniref:DEHA2B14014p n=1 Tax=Debaryomyces hansenii (strain ATCC 36239 / CBS 767 / BCRC 21394 / JCM 1990 / NBRC 0083 / IGC 2968) TaxID=284592 RepID=B5RT04_DEBHA|nr:DEHA2B14014p [Debaryomyces hansenii CBS767]CAR65494.1 DEHA2B14014p [Debaryomyces hansenii CBS767]|eukprot:XP_002770125.1 DEHA2B14014p [Debaryomyces hansenii CBS767]
MQPKAQASVSANDFVTALLFDPKLSRILNFAVDRW